MAKKEIKLVSIVVSIDGKEETIEADKVYLNAYESECEMCGSHGSVELEFDHNKKLHTIELRSW